MHDDTSDSWPDPGGPEPDDAAWLTPQTGWTWDMDALMMGEYVGYPLYLRLRDRLQSLRLPAQTHDALIRELIDTHDVGAISHGSACASLVVTTVDLNNTHDIHDITILDATEMAPLTAKAPPAGDDGWFEK